MLVALNTMPSKHEKYSSISWPLEMSTRREFLLSSSRNFHLAEKLSNTCLNVALSPACGRSFIQRSQRHFPSCCAQILIDAFLNAFTSSRVIVLFPSVLTTLTYSVKPLLVKNPLISSIGMSFDRTVKFSHEYS